jgi:acyl-coenzyme A synthetase/AMP-(fatty) acid ligase
MIFGNRPGEIALGSSGRPVPGVEVRLVDEAGAPIAEPDVPGALELRMRSLCAGYRIRLQSRAAELTRPAERFCGSWFATGDRYQRDAGDHYTHVGRVDDMMRIAAMWVAPCEIEDPISELEQIQDAAAVQVTSVEGLNEIHLFVVPAPGVAPDEVTRSIDARLSALDNRKKPRRIRILDGLPRTPTGKVQRHLLRMYDEHCDAPVTVLADAL